MLEKATALVTRDLGNGRELLVFRHPHAGVQFPAGTVDPGETPAQAAARETWEETGVRAHIAADLGTMADVLPPNRVYIGEDMPLLEAPDLAAPAVLRLQRGWGVWLDARLDAHEGEWVRVRYGDSPFGDPLKEAVAGYLPARVLTDMRRHILHLQTDDARTTWEQTADHDFTFRPFWLPLGEALGGIEDMHPIQFAWLQHAVGYFQIFEPQSHEEHKENTMRF